MSHKELDEAIAHLKNMGPPMHDQTMRTAAINALVRFIPMPYTATTTLSFVRWATMQLEELRAAMEKAEDQSPTIMNVPKWDEIYQHLRGVSGFNSGSKP